MPEHFPKPNVFQKKVLVTAWWSAAHLMHYSFLNPGETITSEKYAQQIEETAPKTAMSPTGFGQQKGPNSSHNNPPPHIIQNTTHQLQKLNELGYKALPHLPYSPDLSPTDYHFIKHPNNFLPGKSFHNQQETENAF